MKKHRFVTRIICTALSLCAAAALILPAALATAPDKEDALLSSDQRSRKNPEGTFVVPAPDTSFRLFHEESREAAGLVAENVAEQFLEGGNDPGALSRIMAYTPIVKPEELPERGEWDDTLTYLLQTGMRNSYVAFLETDDPDVYQAITIYTTRAGKVYWIPHDIRYNIDTGWLYNSDDTGFFGIGFEYNVSNSMVRTATGGWQRSQGYNILFDLGAPLLGIYIDTMRIPFSYQGREWMVQIWKGMYGPSNGGEIGLYEREPGEKFQWDASETYLDMSMKIYQGDKLFLDSGNQNTWWMGAFHYGNYLKTPLLPASKLRMTGRVDFEDQGMLDAFLASFEQNKTGGVTYTVDGLTFEFDWQAKR